jgi:hypothetical protein
MEVISRLLFPVFQRKRSLAIANHSASSSSSVNFGHSNLQVVVLRSWIVHSARYGAPCLLVSGRNGDRSLSSDACINADSMLGLGTPCFTFCQVYCNYYLMEMATSSVVLLCANLLSPLPISALGLGAFVRHGQVDLLLCPTPDPNLKF